MITGGIGKSHHRAIGILLHSAFWELADEEDADDEDDESKAPWLGRGTG